MDYIVARQSPQAGLIEPLRRSFSAHSCTRGAEIGIKAGYATREEAAADAERLTRHVNDPSCWYRATLIDSTVR